MLSKSYFVIKIFASLTCTIQAIYDPNKLAKRYYTLKAINIGSITVANSWQEAATFAEMFNAFLKNTYAQNVRYVEGECRFWLEINATPHLIMQIDPDGYGYADADEYDAFTTAYTKTSAVVIYNKLTKILNKCDFGEVNG